VIDVPDRSDIYVRLTAIKFFLCHIISSPFLAPGSQGAAATSGSFHDIAAPLRCAR